VAVRYELKICHSTTWMAGSKPGENIKVRLLSVVCCVGSGLYKGLNTRPENVCVWSRNLNNKAAYARVGLLPDRKTDDSSVAI
jgi:hypothetical protein